MKSSVLRAPLLALYLTVLGGCAKQSPPPPPPPPVGVVIAATAVVPLTRSLVGRLAPHFSANVTARVSGVLVKRVYAEGSAVKEGQVLFEIDPAYYRTVLNNDLATLAQDEATHVYDRLTAERDRKLLPVGSVSQQTVDDAEATERSAAGKVQADAAAVEGARINLGYTKVSAPIDGIARQQQVTRGALVGAGTSDSGASGTLLTTVDQIDSVYVNFTLSAVDLVTFRQAQAAGGITLAQQDKTTVQIVLPNGSVYPQLGTLDFSDSAVNATTGAVNLRALVPNAQHELLPGLYVTLNVDFGRQRGVFLIPQQALQRDTVGAFLLVVDAGGKVLRKDVSAENSFGDDWIVTSGLAAGDQVVVSGLQSIHEGGVAKPSPWAAPGQKAGLTKAGSTAAANDAPPVHP
jgi:membrane fusion protein (multidrug efflux system)